MGLEGRKELVDPAKSSCTCKITTISLSLGVLNVFQGFFGPKMAVFGPKLQFLKMRFLPKLCLVVLHTHRYHPPKRDPHLKHHDGVLIFTCFGRVACLLLLLAAAAAAAKPGRSTLDTKKGFKTKNEYWDRAGWGGTLEMNGEGHQ